MKTLFRAFIGISFFLLSFSVSAQETGWAIPHVPIQTMDFENFNTADIDNDGNPIIISFWATWCSPCKRELNTIAEQYEDWIDETGVKIVAVSIDDSRNMDKVPAYVNGQAWEYQVLLDPNGEFRRAMNVNNVPHTFLLNGNKEVVWQHNSYSPGDEDELYELTLKVSKGEPLH